MLTGDAMKKQFAMAMPKHLSADRFIRVAITALTRTPKLMECSQESFFKCLLDLSAMGLDPDGYRAHLIPFNNRKLGTVDCQLIVDYKGLVDLVRRDEKVVDVQCYTIRENDSCVVKNGVLEHSYNPMESRGDVKATYTRIDWSSGHTSFGEPMSRDEAELVRKRSKSANSGPWVTDFVEMWKKTNVRRDSKMWPLSPETRESVEKDDDQYQIRNITPQTQTVTARAVPISTAPAPAPAPGAANVESSKPLAFIHRETPPAYPDGTQERDAMILSVDDVKGDKTTMFICEIEVNDKIIEATTFSSRVGNNAKVMTDKSARVFLCISNDTKIKLVDVLMIETQTVSEEVPL